MKEVLTIMMIIYGILIGIYLILGLTKSKQEKLKEKQMALLLMNSMLGDGLKNKKKFIVRIFLFQFILLFGYTLISVWLTYSYPAIQMIAVFLLVIEAIEIVTKLVSVYKAKDLKELMRKKMLSKITPYIYVIGIAILTGTVI